MNKVLNLETIKDGEYKIPKVYFLGISHKFRNFKYVPKVIFFWQEAFEQYFKNNNMKQKIKNLKKDTDKISCEYVDYFMNLFKYINKFHLGEVWSKYDKILNNGCIEFKKTFKQPFEDILTVNPFYYYKIYGLEDLPKEVLECINGKIIIDGGALNGDTALMFHHHFPQSEVHAYEPLSGNYEIMEKFLAQDNCDNKIIPIKKGLGNKEEVVEIKYNYTENAQITTIDKAYENSTPIGLIKLDTEGFESSIIEGAKEVIKRDKPVVVAAMYHTPEDFFDLKDKLKTLNPDYKFMIRRSEMAIPLADLVLIAY